MVHDVIVIGAGAAGLLAASRAAESGRRTLLLEKNKRPGVKILMSGGTRCNLTHATDRQGIVAAFGKPGRFLHSALAALGPEELIALFEAEGVKTKVEPGGKVFPVSDKAADVLAALLRRLQRSGAQLALSEPLQEWSFADGCWTLTTPLRQLHAREVILATGGKSYPGCGTTGDAYRLAAQLGHTIVPPRPALAPLKLADPWAKELRGVTLADVRVSIASASGEALGASRGGFLFTHFGCSGPAPMNVSRAATAVADPTQLKLTCDWLPERRGEALLADLNAAAAGGKRSLLSWASGLLPARLAEKLLERAAIPSEARLAEVSKAHRLRLVQVLKETPLALKGTMGFAKAEVTAGGVSLDEVDSRTMRSKLQPRLLIAGEALDLDGPIGGYNFQAAFSTGWLAGELKER